MQTEMIIPRSPNSANLEETPIENLTPEEMREIIRRQRVSKLPDGVHLLNDQENPVKTEEDIPKLKRERPLSSRVPLRPLKTTKTIEGKTVYHLDSDEEKDAEPPREEQDSDAIEVIEL